uniref:Uncharacterized protein n=1 Tax=Cucumis melo TaxID=3656 RepID=A0A9I9CV63_CUCME
MGHEFLEVQCFSFVAFNQIREGTRKLCSEEDEQMNLNGQDHRRKIEGVTRRKKVALELVEGSQRDGRMELFWVMMEIEVVMNRSCGTGE